MNDEFSSSAPVLRSIWDELELWSKDFTPWQRLLLAAAVRSGVIPQGTLDQAYSLFLSEYGLANVPEPYPSIPGSVTGRVTNSSGKTRLRRIHSPSGINRLPFSSELEFSDGMTIIYGGNGVGKSGFARILSNACFSRQQHPIYSDIFDDSASGTPSACIEVEDETGTVVPLMFDSVTEHAPLKRGFVVFDSAVAERHLRDTGPLGFTPAGFDIFAEMARGYSVLQSKLAADIERRKRDNTFQLAFIGAKTAASNMASELGRRTDLDKLRVLASFGPSERARIDQLQTLGDQLRANSPDGVIRRLSDVRPQLLLIKEKLAEARDALSEEALAADVRLRGDFVAAATAVARLGADQFGHPSLEGIGSSQWEQLIAASQAFVGQQHVHYPSDGDVCVLCHQRLDERSIALFAAYREFAAGEGPAALAAADAKLTARRAKLLTIQLALVDEGSIAHSFLKEAHPTVLSAIEETILALATLRNSAIAALEGAATAASLAAIADFNSTMDDVVALLDHDLSLMRQSDVPSSLKTVEDERAELRHREVLSQNLDQMVSFVIDAQWVAKAESEAKRELNPRHLTEKEQALFATVIADHYRTALANECDALSCGVPIEFKTQGRKGQTVRSLLIRNRSPEDILSEGEQRAVALADFLTEVGLNQHNVGIILDDPVTSLDHDRKERIATRLVQEARRRQIIIFTHDMVFFAKLADAADRADEKLTTHWMQRSGENDLPGMVSLNDGPTTTPQYRNTNFAEDSLAKAKVTSGSEQERLVRQGAAQLRRTVEEIVPQYLFKEVVRRWTDRVMVTSLKKVNWDNALVDELVEIFEACSAIMEGHSHTEAGTQAPPTPVKLEALIRSTKDLIRRAKVNRG
jgi:energy-coupling factor transporter ATP-binding protein EcfA2